MSRTVHLVYPSGPAISCPDAIGRNLAARLRERYEVISYAWDAPGIARPGPDDVLVGHAHPVPWTTFRRSSRLRGWKRIIALAPFVADPAYVAFHEAVIRRCDLFLAITGEYWFRRAARSTLAHWCPKLVHVDLAVDRRDFPRVKDRFAPPGRRRFVYIGNTAPPKNVGYLAAIASRVPGTEFAWIGIGDPIPGVRALGFQDFRREEARRLVADFDFLLTVGRADANPTTILEAMSWGLVPVCTRESGYDGLPGIVNAPLDDVGGAAALIERLQDLPEHDLVRMRQTNDEALEKHFNWDRFAGQVIDAIESPASPALGRAAAAVRGKLLIDRITGPVSPARPSVLWRFATGALARWRTRAA